MNLTSYIISGFFITISLVLGILLFLLPSKKINNMMYGFHTRAITEDQESWDYGQKIGGRTMFICSLLSAAVFVALLIIFRDFFDDFSYLRIILGFVILLLPTATAFITADLKTRKFNKKRFIEKLYAKTESE